MHYTAAYSSPIGAMLLAADDNALVGAWFEGEKYYASCLDKENEPRETPVLRETRRWLDCYFKGNIPGSVPPLNMIGTPFQKAVWDILLKIPSGSTVTYSDIARKIARDRGIEQMSAQAVGTAVGKNNINIIVPCHRVVGANNSLAGYAAGIDKKIYLLKLEKAYRDEFFVPKHTTAP